MIAMVRKQAMGFPAVGTNGHLVRATELAPSLVGGVEFLATLAAQGFAQADGTLPGRTEESLLGDQD